MRRLSDFAPAVLLCHTIDAERLPGWFLSGRPAKNYDDVVAYNVSDDRANLDLLRRNMSTYALDRYLDRFYVWTERNDVMRRQAVLDILFDAMAPDYEHLVNSQQNRENISHLLQALQCACGPLAHKRIIDFGCGVGLSATVARDLSLTVTGFDRCRHMRQQAAAQGMTVWSPRDLATAETGSIDAVFASYLFHLLPELDSLRVLWSRLSVGGALVANFHKSCGVERVTTALVALGAEAHELSHPPSSYSHGVYRTYFRCH